MRWCCMHLVPRRSSDAGEGVASGWLARPRWHRGHSVRPQVVGWPIHMVARRVCYDVCGPCRDREQAWDRAGNGDAPRSGAFQH